MAKTEAEVVASVASKSRWWVTNRRNKLLELRHETHAVNPFLWPIIMSMHGFKTFRELAAFQLAGHLVEGHATGFGKLVDEKILEEVFGTKKLDAAFRRDNPEFLKPEFDNIDHVVPRVDGLDLLSLKAGRWSIQLGQAVQLNRSFQVLLDQRAKGALKFNDIVVGVFYGTPDGLTDKYRIIRGLDTRAKHDVVDISSEVSVRAGREFWSWLNGGENATQEWVLRGIEQGYDEAVQEHGPLDELFEDFIGDFVKQFGKHELADGSFDWYRLLSEING